MSDAATTSSAAASAWRAAVSWSCAATARWARPTSSSVRNCGAIAVVSPITWQAAA